MPTFVDRRCHVVSVTDLHGHILGLLGREQEWRNKKTFSRVARVCSEELNSNYEKATHGQERGRVICTAWSMFLEHVLIAPSFMMLMFGLPTISKINSGAYWAVITQGSCCLCWSALSPNYNLPSFRRRSIGCGAHYVHSPSEEQQNGRTGITTRATCLNSSENFQWLLRTENMAKYVTWITWVA
jgi:hypothetical protein